MLDFSRGYRDRQFHKIRITRVAATILNLLGIDKDAGMDDPISEVIEAMGHCDRVFLYNPDAIAAWIHDKYRIMFEEMEKTVTLQLPMQSVFPPVTPVCFGSMYSGLMPEKHGILKYEKPVLTVRTVFDHLADAGRKAAIVSTEGDSISVIFQNRPIDYYIYKTKEECNRKALELIREDRHDLIVLYNGDYDYQMHRHAPEGKRALQALRENTETYCVLRETIREHWSEHRTALAFAPDHGCHAVFGMLGNHGKMEPCDMNIYHFWEKIPEK